MENIQEDATRWFLLTYENGDERTIELTVAAGTLAATTEPEAINDALFKAEGITELTEERYLEWLAQFNEELEDGENE